MSFEITVVSNTPLTPLGDMDEILSIFLSQVGYIPAGYTPRNAAADVESSIPFRIFRSPSLQGGYSLVHAGDFKLQLLAATRLSV